ncbi:hypothetical protein FAI40_00125 [Acetobacteraceae bacterium]|nr:hypothetical protein FAI40_00125 [Acetobacteraceae bacterium]
MRNFYNYIRITVFSSLLLGGCHHATVSHLGWSDETYISLMETGGDMVNDNRIQAALPFYRQALSRALEADDPESIEVSAYNLALTQLRSHEPEDALKTVYAAQKGLKKHKSFQNSLRLALIQSIALNTKKDWYESLKILAPCLTGQDSEIKTHALYVKGLNDAALKQQNALTEDIQKLSSILGKNKVETENEDELLIRQDLLKRDFKVAEKQAESLSLKRRINHEYDAMREALLLQADALEGLGDEQGAANLRSQVTSSKKASL